MGRCYPRVKVRSEGPIGDPKGLPAHRAMTVEPERPSSLPGAGAGHALESDAAVQALLESSAGQDVHALRAVLRVTQAALGVQRLEDALEVIAEQSRLALDAASFSISRWERDTGVLRTLINVGDLGPGEERHPVDETYPLADYALVADLLRKGEPYIDSIERPGGHRAAGALRQGERAGRPGDVRRHDVGRAVGHRNRRPPVR